MIYRTLDGLRSPTFADIYRICDELGIKISEFNALVEENQDDKFIQDNLQLSRSLNDQLDKRIRETMKKLFGKETI
jgi:hypothetical protein